MAESAVSFAIGKLVPLLTQEVKLLKGIHKEVADIKDGLEIIRAFLKDADSKVEKEGTSEGVKVWIKQAREEAFRIGDIIDEYMLHVAIHGDQSGFMGFIRRIASVVMKLKPRYDIASEIQDIKTSLREIKDRSERFQFISSEQGASSSNAIRTISHDPRLGAHFIEEDEVVGIESSRNELISYLVAGETRRTVISVVGMGGMGKTTFAKKVYDNHRVKQHFGCHVWITVSQSYDKKVLLRTMLKKIFELKNKPFPENILSMEELLLIDELRKCLLPERYFVVFDDVWEVNFWEDVEHSLLENCSGSRILITTRNEDVANFCKRSSMIHVHQMKPLPQQQAWELFCLKAFKFDFDGRCPKDLEELSLAIVERCGGLPLAIVAIGGLLASKQKVAIEWRRFLDSLGSALMSNPHLENVIKILSLSYDDLPYHLKSCFLYFGMFPEDFSIGHGRLIRLWVADGFVLEKQGLTSEEVAEEYLTELIRRSLVQVHGYGVKGIPKTCCVHDLVRDVILSKSEELSFCHISSNSLKVEGIARHLSICNGKGDNPKSSSKSQTRSVMVFSEAELPKPMISSLFAKCKLLTALDFEKCPIDHIPKQLGKLLHLKYLNLRHTLVSKLPKSIGKLHNLESLDLRDSSVVELPVKIDRFPKLQHLLGFSKKRVGVRIHGNIGHLEFIQTMFTIRADVRLVNDLGMLKQLRKLGIILWKREYGKVLCTALENMTFLRSLYVSSANYGDEILEVESISSPPVQLQTLRLWGVLERLPDWISKLDNLTQLILGNSSLMDDPIKVLQGLPSLKTLALVHVYNGEKMHFEEGGFQKLKNLVLSGHEGLNMMIIDQGALPLLTFLAIGGCPQLKEVPSGTQYLKSLFRLSFAEMSNEFNQRLSSNGGEDYWIVKNVPLFVYDDTYDPNDKAWTLKRYVKRYEDF